MPSVRVAPPGTELGITSSLVASQHADPRESPEWWQLPREEEAEDDEDVEDVGVVAVEDWWETDTIPAMWSGIRGTEDWWWCWIGRAAADAAATCC